MTTVVVNHALRQLRAGKLAIGVGLRQARTVDTAQLMKTAGFDWLFIDCEHNSMGTDTAAQIACASLGVGITPIVRVAGSSATVRQPGARIAFSGSGDGRMSPRSRS